MEAGTASPAQARHATTGTDDKTRTGMHGRGWGDRRDSNPCLRGHNPALYH